MPSSGMAGAARSRLDSAMRGAASRAAASTDERNLARTRARSHGHAGGNTSSSLTSTAVTTKQRLEQANGGKQIPFMPSGRPGRTHSVIANVQQALSSHHAYGRSTAAVESESESGRQALAGAIERGLGLEPRDGPQQDREEEDEDGVRGAPVYRVQRPSGGHIHPE